MLTAKTAYFSMEVGLDSQLPTYSGGLGVLAGDTIKAAADLELPMVAVTLLHRKGYFTQKIDGKGQQKEEAVSWDIEQQLEKVPAAVKVRLGGVDVKLQAWKKDVRGVRGGVVSVFFLDAFVDGNPDHVLHLTDSLYGGDSDYRLQQEVLLGCGGVQLLYALGLYENISTYHMNEGHAAFLTLELLKLKSASFEKLNPEVLRKIKDLCVFTTHTPVAAGHDRFAKSQLLQVFNEKTVGVMAELELFDQDNQLNMTRLALYFSRYVNGVAKRHAEVTQRMFPEQVVHGITNGIHAATWASAAFKDLFDKYASGWQLDNNYLRNMCECPLEEINKAHVLAKKSLFEEIRKRTGLEFDASVLTIGFARRAATYKRADLLFQNIERLAKMSSIYPGLQIVFAGKAHPKDEGGKALIKNVCAAREKLAGTNVKLVYLENYDMNLGQKITSGVDVWLNNPVKPMEASGTSGMKAALNGIPSLSTLDGWWVEGCFEGVTGWEIEDAEDGTVTGVESGLSNEETAQNLYRILEQQVLPVFYNEQQRFLAMMRHAIVLNGSFFTTQRMVEQYNRHAYFIKH